MRRKTAFIATLAATIWLGMPTLVRAQTPGTGGESGGSTTTSGEGGTSRTVIAWNPTVHCTAEEGWSVFQLLECLAMGLDSEYNCVDVETVVGGGGGLGYEDEVGELEALPRRICHENPQERSDYRVRLLTNPPGLDVKRRVATDDGSYEPYSFLVREDDTNIKWTRLRVDRPGLEARIQEIQEEPKGDGAVDLYVNGRTITVPTYSNQTPEQLTGSLITGLREQGFTTWWLGDFIVVTRHRYHLVGEPSDITYVAFRCTDSGIKTSELRLARAGIEPGQ